MSDYKSKYFKYKIKYLKLKKLKVGYGPSKLKYLKLNKLMKFVNFILLNVRK